MPEIARRTRFRRGLVVGLTGGYGSGKSSVLAMMRARGAKTLDADALARQALAPGRPALGKVIRFFGRSVLDSQGRLDRALLAERVFDNAKARRRLEKIVHPVVIREMAAAARRHRQGLLVLDVPLLFEARLTRLVDRIIVVWAPGSVRRRRLERRGVSAADFRRRVRAQWPLARKCRLADAVIDNSGSLASTRKQVGGLMKEWGKRRSH